MYISLFHSERQLPLRSPELSIGPGYTFWSPIWYLSQLSKPTYFFHCLNQRLSTRYLKRKKTHVLIIGMLLLPTSFRITHQHSSALWNDKAFLSVLPTIISVSYQWGLHLWSIKDLTNRAKYSFARLPIQHIRGWKMSSWKKNIFLFCLKDIFHFCTFNSCSWFSNSGDQVKPLWLDSPLKK